MPDRATIDPLSWAAQQIHVRAMFGAARALERYARNEPNSTLARCLQRAANRCRNRARCLAAYFGLEDLEEK